MALAVADSNHIISFDDLFIEDRPTLVVQKSGSVLEENLKDPFVTPQSHNLCSSGGELSTFTIQGSQTMDNIFKFNASTNHVDADEWDLLKLEKSPWHESDSGVSSVMSDAGSPAGSYDLSTNEATSTMPFVEWPELGEEADLDLAAYLLGTNVSMVADNGEVGNLNHQGKESNLSHDEIQTQNVHSTRGNDFVAPQKTLPLLLNGVDEFDVDVENSDGECSNNVAIRPHKHSSHISEPLNFFKESKKKPSVKIVKVLKSANSDGCDDDILKALDERSRKNAIQAKMNREKKKKYVSSLEEGVEKLGEENKNLQDENAELKKELSNLEEEVRYLKSVLVNASPLSGMLRNISGVSEVNLSATIVGRKRGASDCDDHSYTAGAKIGGDIGRAQRSAKRARMVRENLEKAGVCLHVNGKEASLEFCAKCSSLAQRSQSQSRKS